MDTQRLVLFVALSLTILFMWQAWQKDYGPQPVPASVSTAMSETAPATTEGVPTGDLPRDVPRLESAPAASAPEAAKAVSASPRVHVVTDVLDLEIDTRGGDIRELDLPTYPVAVDTPDQPFRLMGDQADLFYVAQSGLLSTADAPDHHALYTAEATEYRLPAGQDELRVPLHWTGTDGLEVTKIFIFKRGAFSLTVEHQVTNRGQAPWSGRQYRQLQRTKPDEAHTQRFVNTYTGAAIYSPEAKYEKIKFEDMEKHPLDRDIHGGWGAMIQHYFVAAWVPLQDQVNHYYSKVLSGSHYVLGMISEPRELAPGASTTFTSTLFAGPKLQNEMAALATGLDLTVDYGYLTVIAKPVYWLLEFAHDLIGNWGWAIVIVTLLIKLAFYRLSATSYRSMANMRKLQPRLQAIKERYGDDRQKLNEKMMQIYKDEKINPLGGCLPIAIQIPVFIALYWVLLESVELRQAPFILWINDLSTKDPYYVLPILMGITMLAQQKLNPAPIDPIQAKVMMALPFVFTVFFAFFPSGLVLYWVVNSGLSIAQQWMITRSIEAAK